MSGKISVIVPVYNVEKYLARCLDSILAQTYRDLEIICVNDESPDSSLSILQKYAQKDERVIVLTRKNGGLSAARNTGLDAATGDYIMFVDSDDLIEPNMAEILLSALTEHNADIVNCQFDNYYSAEDIVSRGHKHPPFVLNTKEAARLLLKDSQVTNHVWRNLYKRNIIDNIRFPEGKVYEDIFTTIKFFLKAEKVAFISDELYHYFCNYNGLAKSASFKQRMDYLEAITSIFSVLKKCAPDLLDMYTKVYIKKMLHARKENLTYYKKYDIDGRLTKFNEFELRKYLTKDILKNQPYAFINILLFPITKHIVFSSRNMRLFRYKIMAKIRTKHKRRHYLEKIKRETS